MDVLSTLSELSSLLGEYVLRSKQCKRTDFRHKFYSFLFIVWLRC